MGRRNPFSSPMLRKICRPIACGNFQTSHLEDARQLCHGVDEREYYCFPMFDKAAAVCVPRCDNSRTVLLTSHVPGSNNGSRFGVSACVAGLFQSAAFIPSLWRVSSEIVSIQLLYSGSSHFFLSAMGLWMTNIYHSRWSSTHANHCST